MSNAATSLVCFSALSGVVVSALGAVQLPPPPAAQLRQAPDRARVVSAFAANGLRVSDKEEEAIRENVQLAIDDARAHGAGNSKVRFAAVEIARALGVDGDQGAVGRVEAAIRQLSGLPAPPAARRGMRPAPPRPGGASQWDAHFDETLDLRNRPGVIGLMGGHGFSMVKTSWEDTGWDRGGAGGDRISDVGVWVRRREDDPSSARPALSVRRGGPGGGVMVAPSEKIKVHVRQGGRVLEKTLPRYLAELGLSHPARDKNVMVSSQFAVVPVPGGYAAPLWPRPDPTIYLPGLAAPRFHGADAAPGTDAPALAPGADAPALAPGGDAPPLAPGGDAPARVAFNFSINPHGSAAYVITDTPAGGGGAVVSGSSHQLLFADIDGQRAPFTASRAGERQDLERLEAGLKSEGMDADVQRVYLVQVPLKDGAKGLAPGGMGAPPKAAADPADPRQAPIKMYPPGRGPRPLPKPKPKVLPAPRLRGELPPGDLLYPDVMPPRRGASGVAVTVSAIDLSAEGAGPGLARVAIGHGEPEGPYSAGGGFRGNRAPEPVRVTVVYFVTPKGPVQESDMEKMAETFAKWDGEAIWGGSFTAGGEPRSVLFLKTEN